MVGHNGMASQPGKPSVRRWACICVEEAGRNRGRLKLPLRIRYAWYDMDGAVPPHTASAVRRAPRTPSPVCLDKDNLQPPLYPPGADV
ncbi:unnamed protein product [Arctogadus glacialis]